ncbi:Pisatin demethylase 7 [Seiridium cupressi]
MSSAKNLYRRGEANKGNRFNPYHDTMFTVLDPEQHDKVKAMVAAASSGRDTPGLESNVDDQVRSLIALIRGKYISSYGKLRPLSLSRISGLFTLDVISKVALGDEFGYLRSDADLHEPYSTLRAYIQFMETDAYGMGKPMGLTNIAVRKRFAPDTLPQRDMLGSFIRHDLNQQSCETESLFIFVAGSDTTAATIRVTMLHVLSNPRVYHSLKAEVKRAIQEGKVSTPITSAEGKALQYLQAVMYEGLRIRPIVSGLIFKSVPLSGDTINGRFLPGGTAVGTNMPSLLRNNHTFAEDADIVRPERFLELDSNGLAEMRRNVELQFGCGRRMCAGKPLAQIELNKVFFWIGHHSRDR